MTRYLIAGAALSLMMSSAATADWSFSGPPNSKALMLAGNMALELQCDRVRSAPGALAPNRAPESPNSTRRVSL